mmetsp:Transcript_10327/g.13544  ORF Transcript_10327/g.13544 Transcript_10327/m.13544 type:complete len:233 (-) Transcript_10327:1775-2473(-)
MDPHSWSRRCGSGPPMNPTWARALRAGMSAWKAAAALKLSRVALRRRSSWAAVRSTKNRSKISWTTSRSLRVTTSCVIARRRSTVSSKEEDDEDDDDGAPLFALSSDAFIMMSGKGLDSMTATDWHTWSIREGPGSPSTQLIAWPGRPDACPTAWLMARMDLTRERSASTPMRASVSISWQIESVTIERSSGRRWTAIVGVSRRRSMHTVYTEAAVVMMNDWLLWLASISGF